MSARRRCLPRTQRRKSIPLPLRTFRPPPPLLRACRAPWCPRGTGRIEQTIRHRQKQRQPGLRILIIGRSLALRRSSSSLDSTIPSPITPMHESHRSDHHKTHVPLDRIVQGLPVKKQSTATRAPEELQIGEGDRAQCTSDRCNQAS